MKTHPVRAQVSPTFQPSPVCQPRLLNCDDCNVGFNTVKKLQLRNKNYHTRSKPTCGHGCGSLPRSPKPPSVSTSVAKHSGNGNNTQKIPTPSGSENSPGKSVPGALPLKNIPVQHINDSCPKPINHTWSSEKRN